MPGLRHNHTMESSRYKHCEDGVDRSIVRLIRLIEVDSSEKMVEERRIEKDKEVESLYHQSCPYSSIR